MMHLLSAVFICVFTLVAIAWLQYMRGGLKAHLTAVAAVLIMVVCLP